MFKTVLAQTKLAEKCWRGKSFLLVLPSYRSFVTSKWIRGLWLVRAVARLAQNSWCDFLHGFAVFCSQSDERTFLLTNQSYCIMTSLACKQHPKQLSLYLFCFFVGGGNIFIVSHPLRHPGNTLAKHIGDTLPKLYIKLQMLWMLHTKHKQD